MQSHPVSILLDTQLISLQLLKVDHSYLQCNAGRIDKSFTQEFLVAQIITPLAYACKIYRITLLLITHYKFKIAVIRCQYLVHHTAHTHYNEGDPTVILFLLGVNKKQSSRLVQASKPQFTKRK